MQRPRAFLSEHLKKGYFSDGASVLLGSSEHPLLPAVEGRAKSRDCSLPETTQLAVLEPGLAHSFLIPVHFLCC